MYNIWKQTSVKVLFSRIISVANKLAGLKFVLTFAALYVVCMLLYRFITTHVNNMVTQSWTARVKANPIQDNLAKYNAWWGSDDGAAVYSRTNNITIGTAIINATGFVKKHFEMTSTGCSNSNLVHLWDKKFRDMVDPWCMNSAI